MAKVIELIRVSRIGNVTDGYFSVSAQRSINRRTARMYGLVIVHSLELINVSGAAVLKAPEMQVLLEAIQSPEIAGVVTCEFARIMRPECFSDYVLLQALCDSKTILYLPEGPLDFKTPSGRFFGALRATIAGLQRNELAARVWAAMEANRKAGVYTGGSLPYGVGFEASRGWFYTSEAKKIKKAFQLFLSGVTNYRRIARALGIQPLTLVLQ